MDTAHDVKEMWWSEVRPLVEELELRENRANHIDRASMICEIIERFDLVVGNAVIPAGDPKEVS
jgi:hypothetical protein